METAFPSKGRTRETAAGEFEYHHQKDLLTCQRMYPVRLSGCYRLQVAWQARYHNTTTEHFEGEIATAMEDVVKTMTKNHMLSSP